MMRSQKATVTTGTSIRKPRNVTAFMFEGLRSPQWAAIPLRLVVGFGFMEHGYTKLIKGPAAFVSIIHALGVPYPHVMAWVTILIELLGGFTVLIGAFIPLISLPLAGLLLVAMLTVHLPYGFSSIKLIAVTPAGPQFGPPGYECDLLYLTGLAALVLIGSGPFSVDGLLSRGAARRDDQRSKSISPSSHSLRRT
jgi:putative oxidoreductase